MHVKILKLNLLNTMFNLIHFLGADPCHVSGQVVLVAQIHSELCCISYN